MKYNNKITKIRKRNFVKDLYPSTVPTVYQRCTNRKKQSKTVKRRSKQKKWPLVYQSSQVYQDCTNSPSPSSLFDIISSASEATALWRYRSFIIIIIIIIAVRRLNRFIQ